MKLIKQANPSYPSGRYVLLADNGGTILAEGPTPETVLSIMVEKARLAIADYLENPSYDYPSHVIQAAVNLADAVIKDKGNEVLYPLAKIIADYQNKMSR